MRTTAGGCYLLAACLAVTAGAGARALAFAAAAADEPPPRPYEVTAGDGYVFVMLLPAPLRQGDPGWSEGAERVQRAYRQSGMYRKGQPAPLWPVDWYSPDVAVAPDGVHLVRLNLRPPLPNPDRPPAPADLQAEALSFFAGGKLLRSYTVAELVESRYMLGTAKADFTWRREGKLDGAGLRYELTTLDDNVFTFDLRTGEIVSEVRCSLPALTRRALSVWGILGAALAAAGVALVLCRWAWRVVVVVRPASA